MSLVDNDLLSIQEARILLEHVEESKEILEGLPATLVDRLLAEVATALLPNVDEYAELAYAESDYCSPADEAALTRWVLEDLFSEVSAQVPAQDIRERACGHAAAMVLSKGVVVSFLPDWLTVPTMLSQLACAIRSKSPIVVSVRPRAHAVAERVLKDLREVAERLHYPVEALGFLSTWSAEGEQWLAAQDGVRVIIDGRDYEHMGYPSTRGKDVYFASVGNNPVFVEATADLAHCAEEVVAGASFCFGLLPGAEQSVVAELAVTDALKSELAKRGCRFLTEEESSRLAHVMFSPDGRPYRELIGKSATDLARRADIVVPDGTKVLAVEKPYVSERSLYSGVKYGPVISYYVEESWRGACEKCIELILGKGHGNALAIFSRDAEVIRQFILKKPVGRILVNASTGLGAIGCHSSLPKTLTIAGWDFATTSDAGVTYQDFVRRRQIGIGASEEDYSLLQAAGMGGKTYERPERDLPMGETSCQEAAEASRETGVAPASTDDWFSSLLESVREH